MRSNLGFEVELLPCGNLFFWCHPNDIALFSHVQTFGLQDDVQSLIPGYVLQTQRNGARHRVRCDDIEFREVGNDLQHRTHVNALKVERQLLACEHIGIRQIGIQGGLVGDRHHGDGQHVADLNRVELPLTVGLNPNPYAITRLGAGDGLYRGCKITHIHAPAQRLGQPHLVQLHSQTLAQLAYIRNRLVRRQRDYHQTRTLGPTFEINILHRALDCWRRKLGHCR